MKITYDIPVKHRLVRKLISGSASQHLRITFNIWDETFNRLIKFSAKGSIHATSSLLHFEDDIEQATKHLSAMYTKGMTLLEKSVQELIPNCPDAPKTEDWLLRERKDQREQIETCIASNIYSKMLCSFLIEADKKITPYASVAVLGGQEAKQTDNFLGDWFKQTRSYLIIDPVRTNEALSEATQKHGEILPSITTYTTEADNVKDAQVALAHTIDKKLRRDLHPDVFSNNREPMISGNSLVE